MSDKYYSRVLMHGSKYGGFITKNGRKNNSSQYNHNYYLANIFKWKKKNKDGDEEEGDEPARGIKYGGGYANVKKRLSYWQGRMSDPRSAIGLQKSKNADANLIALPDVKEKYNSAATSIANAKTRREKAKAKKDMILAKKALREVSYKARKELNDWHENSPLGKQDQKKRNKQTKALREKHLSKGYVDMTSNRKQTVEAHYRGDKILEKNSNNLLSKTRQVKDSSGRTTTYKDVGKLERAGRDTKKKVDRLIAKYSSKKNKKKKNKSRIKVSHNTSLGIGK